MAASSPNHVPVSAPHMMVVADSRYMSSVTFIIFFVRAWNTIVPMRKSVP